MQYAFKVNTKTLTLGDFTLTWIGIGGGSTCSLVFHLSRIFWLLCKLNFTLGLAWLLVDDATLLPIIYAQCFAAYNIAYAMLFWLAVRCAICLDISIWKSNSHFQTWQLYIAFYRSIFFLWMSISTRNYYFCTRHGNRVIGNIFLECHTETKLWGHQLTHCDVSLLTTCIMQLK